MGRDPFSETAIAPCEVTVNQTVRQPDLLCSFQVEHQLKRCRLLDAAVSGLRTLQDLVYVRGSAPIQVDKVCRIGHQATDCLRPLRRLSVLLTLLCCLAESNSRRPRHGRVWERSPSEAP